MLIDSRLSGSVCICRSYTDLKNIASRVSSIVTGSEDFTVVEEDRIILGAAQDWEIRLYEGFFWLDFRYGEKNQEFLNALRTAIRYLLAVDVIN